MLSTVKLDDETIASGSDYGYSGVDLVDEVVKT